MALVAGDAASGIWAFASTKSERPSDVIPNASHNGPKFLRLLDGSETKGQARAKHHNNNDEREAAEKLGELFGTDWPEIAEKKLISVPNLSHIPFQKHSVSQ